MRKDGNETRPPLTTGQVVITGIAPEVDAGRYPICCCVGDSVTVEADLFRDSDAPFECSLLYRKTAAMDWVREPMLSMGDDRWVASFPVTELGNYEYTLAAQAHGTSFAYDKVLSVRVDRERAGYGAWYELFPRSCGPEPGRHGTLRDVGALLPYVAGMGFDVLLLPPIHPIGWTNRRGEAGSPWAIGSAEGGHTAVHPQLGTLADFRRLVEAAKSHGLEIALDIALQCSPDHPWVREHPDWFRDGHDPQHPDILHFDFQAASLRQALKDIFDFWIGQGVRILQADSPHAKPFAFWEWLIREVKRQHPDVIFVAKSFARPKVLHHLAKLGFDQSYTYFPWRNTKAELEAQCREFQAAADYLRPNLWANTPDILSPYLQDGGVAAFEARLVLAATLSASYGIYGPAYELQVSQAQPGSEENVDSEKYVVQHWERDRDGSLYDFIARLNRIRRHNPALQANRSLRFHATDNEQLICYSKQAEDNIIVTAVNLDPHQTQAGWLELAAEAFGLEPTAPIQVHDLISDARFVWQGSRQFISLDPRVCPAQVFNLSENRSER